MPILLLSPVLHGGEDQGEGVREALTPTLSRYEAREREY